jgi:hypothetical protein
MSMCKINNYIKNIIFWTIIALLLLGVCIFVYIGVTTTTDGYNLDYSPSFPKSASNISYHFSFSHNYFEYDISLDNLRDVAKDRGWIFSDIPPDEGITILCYPYTDQHKKELNKNKSRIVPYERTIKNGLFYDTLGRRGGIVVVYDKDLNRLFFFSSRR